MTDEDEDEVPEEAEREPRVETPDEDAQRADERLDRQNHDRAPRWPHTKDPLRQPGESTPAPEKRHEEDHDARRRR